MACGHVAYLERNLSLRSVAAATKERKTTEPEKGDCGGFWDGVNPDVVNDQTLVVSF